MTAPAFPQRASEAQHIKAWPVLECAEAQMRKINLHQARSVVMTILLFQAIIRCVRSMSTHFCSACSKSNTTCMRLSASWEC
jgi:molybdenum cofactor biosynthesis enzyme MoaA